MNNYELKEWTISKNKSIMVLKDQNGNEERIEIKNTYENVALQIEKLLQEKDTKCQFANGLVNIDIVKEKDGEFKLIKDDIAAKKEYKLTKITTPSV